MGDLFYLRFCLKHIAAPTSFKDLCTVDEEFYPDFKDECIALGLCDNDSKLMEAMAEWLSRFSFCYPRIVLQHHSPLQNS